MNRYERVVQILDEAIGGPDVSIAVHGTFWRGVSRDQFVAKKVFGFDLIKVGDGAGSNLIKALKGESPFGVDLPEPPPDSSMSRMPAGLDPVSAENIGFIRKWIDEGCLEDPFVATPVVDEAPLRWHRTGAPTASSRTDDVWFKDPSVGWAVNSNGQIIHTTDGGAIWTVQHHDATIYWRCIGFASPMRGWVGSLTANKVLFETSNGGQTWSRVTNLPALAPQAVCGLSVVDQNVVYASGTNFPNRAPRIMKTTDGGATWQAKEMRPFADILIDCRFTSATTGWVVGGKTDQPTPTRDNVRPVVLFTTDGGETWTNRVAGLTFPAGEWGWKIQFLNDRVGFVSLENFREGAILRTDDGGLTWTRLKINDAQQNANLEGVGFVDERHGWVGGWGDAQFQRRSTSETLDGGLTWRDANEVGLAINRFRFFGNPVTVGYASGETVYKYSSEPSPLLAFAILPERGVLLKSNEIMVAEDAPFTIPITVPAGSKQLSAKIWDRFGEEIHTFDPQLKPSTGVHRLQWDLRSANPPLLPGEYLILRVTVDSTSESCLLRTPPASASAPRSKTLSIQALMKAAPEVRDLTWLKNALQAAIELEFATLPPYLIARWTIRDQNDSVSRSIQSITREEMLHYGLTCNLLVAIGGQPALDASVPSFPGPLPGGVHPGLIVGLKRLSIEQAQIFMEIEEPQFPPIEFVAVATTYSSIGEFYDAILEAFEQLNPPLALDHQLSGPLGLTKIDSMDAVRQAIGKIKKQGEGSTTSPEDSGDADLAHFYRFREIVRQKKFVRNPQTGQFENGDPFPLPAVWPMADIPEGGYRQPDVPDAAVWDLIDRCDVLFTEMLRNLQLAWATGEAPRLGAAVVSMRALGTSAIQLVQKPRPDGAGNYGPCFRLK